MSEGQPIPQLAPEPVTLAQETGNSENAVGFITSLIEQQITSGSEEDKARYTSQEVQVYNMLMDLRAFGPRIWQDTAANVFTGYGSLIYDKLPMNKQAIFLHAAREEQEARGADLELTEEEGEILKNITHTIGMEYDPGAAENPEKRTFRLADIEKKAPDHSQVAPSFRRFLDADLDIS